jgi:hypothetical protein
MRSQRRWPSAIASEFRSLLRVRHYLSAYGATPPEGATLVPRPWRGRITLSCGTQDRRYATRIRPFQGRAWSGGAFSGGVAPGYCIDPLRGSRMDSGEDVLGDKNQVKRLLVRSA